MGDTCTIIRMLVEDNIYGSVVTHGFATVSYTHLDVYKRQGRGS